MKYVFGKFYKSAYTRKLKISPIHTVTRSYVSNKNFLFVYMYVIIYVLRCVAAGM